MHSLFAHIYHLVVRPFWHAPVAAFAAGLMLRRFGHWAALAVLAGWLAAQYPVLTVLPDQPIYRLAGLAVLLLCHTLLAPRAPRRPALAGFALLASWWIAGAPVAGPGLAVTVPTFMGVWAVLWLTDHLAREDRGWASLGAAVALAASMLFAGAAPHWGRAALVPAVAGLALIGVPGATPPLAYATMLVACLAVVASNRGRFLPVDMAALAPLLVWFLAARLRRAGAAIGASKL